MLYKAPRSPARAAHHPVKSARRNIAQVAKDLGAGSSRRALYQFAREHPKEFWTQLYRATVEKELTVKHGVDDSLGALLAQAFTAAGQHELAQAPIKTIEAPRIYIEGAQSADSDEPCTLEGENAPAEPTE